MNKDSLRGAIFVLIVAALGTGIMTLHHFFNNIGIIPALIIIVLVGAMFIFVSDILIFSLKKSPESRSLNNIYENVLGKKFKNLFDATFFVYLFLVMVSVVIAVSKTTYMNFGPFILLKFFDIDVYGSQSK